MTKTNRHELSLLDPQLFRQPHFRLVDDLFEACKTGERETIDRNHTDFSDRRFFQRRTTTFLVN